MINFDSVEVGDLYVLFKKIASNSYYVVTSKLRNKIETIRIDAWLTSPNNKTDAERVLQTRTSFNKYLGPILEKESDRNKFLKQVFGDIFRK
jgi:hypothetical protein